MQPLVTYCRCVECDMADRNAIEQSPAWENGNCSATKELLHIYGNRNSHCRVQSTPPLVPFSSRWIQSKFSHSICERSILILSPILRLGFPKESFPQGPSKLCMFLMRIPYLPPWLGHSNKVWRWLPIMKLFLTQLSPPLPHFLRCRCKYSSQHPVLEHPHIFECQKPKALLSEITEICTLFGFCGDFSGEYKRLWRNILKKTVSRIPYC